MSRRWHLTRNGGRLLAAAGLTAALLPAAANASTVAVVNGSVVYDAAPGEVNTVDLFDASQAPGAIPGEARLWVRDTTATVTAGAGCEPAPQGAFCDGTLPVIAQLLDQNDHFIENRYPFPTPITVSGGSGNDQLIAGSAAYNGNYTLDGGPGNDTLHAGYGSAKVTGGDGADTITLTGMENADVDAGPGADTVSFDSYYDAFSVSLKLGSGNDSLSLSSDAFLGSTTTPYGNFATFNYPASAIQGGPGSDTVKPQAPAGVMFDLSSCACGVENIDRGYRYFAEYPQGDLLIGSDEPNYIRGGNGSDIIFAKGGTDLVVGGAGNDRIITSGDKVVDFVTCGRGVPDTVDADGTDLLASDCEKKGRLYR